MIYVGIDPGASGAIAIIDQDHHDAVLVKAHLTLGAAVAMPLDAEGGVDVLALHKIFDGRMHPPTTIVVLEKAQAMPKNGSVSMFNYGKGVGRIEAFLRLGGWRFEEVRPTTWKKVVLKDTAKDKAATIDYVTRAFPGVSLLPTPRSKKPHDGMADALCLAEYGRRTYGAAAAPTS